MKKLLLLIFLVSTFVSYGQSVQYFGGIYKDTAYFNWVFKNTDTCYFIAEISYDGKMYQEIFRTSDIQPMPIAVLHGLKIPMCENTWFRVVFISKTKESIYEAENFQLEKYIHTIKIHKYDIVYAKF